MTATLTTPTTPAAPAPSVTGPGTGRSLASVSIGSIGPTRLLAGLDSPLAARLTDYSWHRAELGPMTLVGHGLERAIADVDLRGRGGAGFPLARKLAAIQQAPRSRRAVVVNACEGDPGSAKDRVLITRTPHTVLDGAVAIADLIGSRRIVVAVTDEPAAYALRAAVATRPDAAMISVQELPDRFVTGEATALLRGLTHGPDAAVPAGIRVLPTHAGLDGRPTLVSNAETFAQVGVLGRLG